jgi:hypothetical protein
MPVFPLAEMEPPGKATNVTFEPPAHSMAVNSASINEVPFRKMTTSLFSIRIEFQISSNESRVRATLAPSIEMEYDSEVPVAVITPFMEISELPQVTESEVTVSEPEERSHAI